VAVNLTVNIRTVPYLLADPNIYERFGRRPEVRKTLARFPLTSDPRTPKN